MNTESEEFAASNSDSTSFGNQNIVTIQDAFSMKDALWTFGLLTVTLCLSPAAAFYMLLVA